MPTYTLVHNTQAHHAYHVHTHTQYASTLCIPQAVREQIRKLAVGGPPGKDTAVYQVSDSEDEDLEEKQDLTRCGLPASMP